MGIGVYATVSWVQSLARRDPATFAMIFKSRAMIYAMLSAPIGGFVGYGVAFWTAPLLMRAHDTSAAEVGLWIGIGAAASGIVGVAGGGFLADRLRMRFTSTMQSVDGKCRTSLFHALRDVVASGHAGQKQVATLQGGGGLSAQRIVTRSRYDLEGAKRQALQLAGLDAPNG